MPSTLRDEADPHLLILRMLAKRIGDARASNDLETARFQLYRALERRRLSEARGWLDAARVAIDTHLDGDTHTQGRDALRAIEALVNAHAHAVEPPVEVPPESNWEWVCERIRAVVETRPAPARHAARSAIRYADQGMALFAEFPEVAMFQFITGEEEAATAIFRSLQRLDYPGAAKLNFRVHEFKATLRPFLEAVWETIGLVFVEHGWTPRLVVEKPERGDKFHVEVRIQGPPERLMTSDNPLDFNLHDEGPVEPFRAQLATVLRRDRVEDVTRKLRARADVRNRILYAGDEGLPHIENPRRELFEALQTRIFVMLYVYLLIDQTEEHQLLPLQLLPVFLKLVSEVRRHEIKEFSADLHKYR